MAIIQNPAQGAGRQSFTSMLSIADLIGTARSLDLRENQVELETNVKALKDIQAKDVLDVQQDVNKFAKLSPEHFQMAQDQAQTGNFSVFDDAARAAIKRGEITATGYQAWKGDYTKALKEETDFTQASMKAMREGNALQNPRDIAKSVYGVDDKTIEYVKRTDPKGYADIYRKINWAYNSDKGKEILENSVLLNLDAQGKPIADQSGNLSYRLGPDGAKMTGKEDFDHAFRQYMGRQGTGLNLSASNPWGTYGKAAQANAASPMQGKGEAEAEKAIAEGNKAAVDPLFVAETKRVLPGIGDSGVQQFRTTLSQYRNRVTDPQMVAATETILKDQPADSPARKMWEAMKSDPRKRAIQDTARDLGITPNLESAPSAPNVGGTVFSPTSAAVPPVAAKPMVKDGDRVRDKNTGKYFIMRGGKMVPLE